MHVAYVFFFQNSSQILISVSKYLMTEMRKKAFHLCLMSYVQLLLNFSQEIRYHFIKKILKRSV